MYQQEEEARGVSAFDVVSFQSPGGLRGAPTAPPAAGWGSSPCSGNYELSSTLRGPQGPCSSSRSGSSLIRTEATHGVSLPDRFLRAPESPREVGPLSMAAPSSSSSSTSSSRSHGGADQEQQQAGMSAPALGPLDGGPLDGRPLATPGLPFFVSLEAQDKLLQMTHISAFASPEPEEETEIPRSPPGCSQLSLGRGWWRRARGLLISRGGAPSGEDFLLEMGQGGPPTNPFGEPSEDYLVEAPRGGQAYLSPRGDTQRRQHEQPQQQQQQGIWARCAAAAAGTCGDISQACKRLLQSSPSREPQHHLLVPLLLFVVCCSVAAHSLIARGRWGLAAVAAACAAAAGAAVQIFVSVVVVREFKAAHPQASSRVAAAAIAARWVSYLQHFAASCSSKCSKLWDAAARCLLRALRMAGLLQQQRGRETARGLAEGALLGGETLGGSVEMEVISARDSTGGPPTLVSVPVSPLPCRGSETPAAAAADPTSEEAEQLLHALLAAPFVGLLTGTLAGLVGIGGGLVFSPMLLLLHVDPVVAVATSSACVVYTSSATSLQFLLLGRLHLLPCIILGITAAAAAAAGCLGVHAMRRLFAGRRSFIAFLVAAAIAMATLMTLRRYLHGGPI